MRRVRLARVEIARSRRYIFRMLCTLGAGQSSGPLFRDALDSDVDIAWYREFVVRIW